MPLLARRLLIVSQDAVDEVFVGIQNRGRRVEPDVAFWLWHRQDLADLPPRMMEKPGKLANAHSVDEMSSADTCKFVHRDHPSPPCSWTWCTSLQEAMKGGPVFDKLFCTGVGPNWTSVTTWK